VSDQDLGTILGVWAHPDDETYLSAGIMADAVRKGARVVCVTATRGEGGSMDEERWPAASMGEVRERELLRSFEVLGVREHTFLGLPDIDMDTPLPEEGYEQVLALVEEVRPDTVLTFGPDGMTGHRAHMSVSAWATESFRSAAPAGARLFYATYTPEWSAEWLEQLAPFEIFRPGTPPVTPRADLGIDYRLPADLAELKIRAIERHESQVEALLHVFGVEGFRTVMGEEYFRLAEAKEA
jgi:LmbE family N-acetylglucosaminyl deacetylase